MRGVGGKQRIAHARPVGIVRAAHGDLHGAREALVHHRHVRFHHRVTEAGELLHVLRPHDLLELLRREVIAIEKRGNTEEGAQKRVALHAQLQLGLTGGLPGNVEAGKDVHLDVVLEDELAVRGGNALPGGIGTFARFPHQHATALQPLQRVGVRERLRVAAEHHVHVIQLAIHLDLRRRHREVVVGGRALLLRPVLGVGHHEELVLENALLVVGGILCGQVLPEVADDRAQVLAGRDHPPTANRVEPHRNRPFRQQAGRILADHGIRVLHPQHEVALPILGGAAVGPGGNAGGELVRPDDVLGTEVARADAVGAAEEAGRFVWRDAGERAAVARGFVGLAQGHTNVTGQRVVAGQAFVGPLEDDDARLAAQRLDDGLFREGANDVDVDRADLCVALVAQVIAGRLDVLGRAAE